MSSVEQTAWRKNRKEVSVLYPNPFSGKTTWQVAMYVNKVIDLFIAP